MFAIHFGWSSQIAPVYLHSIGYNRWTHTTYNIPTNMSIHPCSVSQWDFCQMQALGRTRLDCICIKVGFPKLPCLFLYLYNTVWFPPQTEHQSAYDICCERERSNTRVSELRFVATVTTSGRVKFVPTVQIFPENNAISRIICGELQDLHTHKCDFALKL